MNAQLFETRPISRRRRPAEQRNHYAERLARVLGNGRDWSYRGECFDLGWPSGICACGHTGLRYLFTLHHADGLRTVKVGSVCVENFPGISGHLAATLAAEVTRLQSAALAAERGRLLGPITLF